VADSADVAIGHDSQAAAAPQIIPATDVQLMDSDISRRAVLESARWRTRVWAVRTTMAGAAEFGDHPRCQGIEANLDLDGERPAMGELPGQLSERAVLLGVFLLVQARRQDREPLIPFALLKDRNYTALPRCSGARHSAHTTQGPRLPLLPLGQQRPVVEVTVAAAMRVMRAGDPPDIAVNHLNGRFRGEWSWPVSSPVATAQVTGLFDLAGIGTVPRGT
jgi:hypothetical protein